MAWRRPQLRLNIMDLEFEFGMSIVHDKTYLMP